MATAATTTATREREPTKEYNTRQILSTLGKTYWGASSEAPLTSGILEGDGTYLGVFEWIAFINGAGVKWMVKCVDGLPLPSITDAQLHNAGLPVRADLERWIHKRAGQRRRRAEYRRRQATAGK